MILYIVLGVLSLVILFQPYLGIVITLASLPLTNVLPPISWANSVLTLLGGVTLASALLAQMQKKSVARKPSKQPPIILLGFLFLLWLSLSNPAAAMAPDEKGRIWAITFIQLWVFAALTSVLFDTPKKLNILTWAYVIVSIISAVYAVFQQGNIGAELTLAERAAGLAGGANTAARYFVFALMLGLFFYQQQKNGTIRLALISGIIILIVGVVFTVSRTGLLLLAGGTGLFITQNTKPENRIRTMFVVALGILTVWFVADNIATILKGIVPSITVGTDTVRIRYGLWQAGWRMWLDYPVAGVGVGRFTENLRKYAWDLLPSRYLILGAHNMYVAVLAETGIVGLVLFIGMFVASLRALSDSTKSQNVEIANLARIWLVVLILVMLAGITKHDHFEKFNWIVVGISAGLYKMGQNEKNIMAS